MVYLKTVFIVIGLSNCQITDFPITYKLSDYMIRSQIVGNIWSFKPIKFEKSVIFMIITTFTIILSIIIITMIIIASIRTKPSKVSMTWQKMMMIFCDFYRLHKA